MSRERVRRHEFQALAKSHRELQAKVALLQRDGMARLLRLETRLFTAERESRNRVFRDRLEARGDEMLTSIEPLVMAQMAELNASLMAGINSSPAPSPPAARKSLRARWWVAACVGILLPIALLVALQVVAS